MFVLAEPKLNGTYDPRFPKRIPIVGTMRCKFPSQMETSCARSLGIREVGAKRHHSLSR